uniref:DUF4773 domain-containing protein n=1 Tax=Caenorhabditis tropicalis TaxID=1561998 RepID=A0A1I7UFT2_9PELO
MNLFFFLVLIVIQLVLQTDAKSLQKTEANAEKFKKLVETIFPLPRFGPEEDRRPNNLGVHRFGKFGPHCGVDGECTGYCLCCGECIASICKEPFDAVDYCAISDMSFSLLPQKVQNYELPSDFPDRFLI